MFGDTIHSPLLVFLLSFALVQCVHIVVIVVIIIQIAPAAVFAAITVDDLLIVTATVTVVCIVIVVDTSGAAVGAATAAATCAGVTYARLWFDSYGSRHVVVSVVEIVRGGRSGGKNLAASRHSAVRRSVQRRPQLADIH